MLYRVAADLVVILHLLFIAYVLIGGFLVLVHRAWGIVHLPAVVWAAMIEFRGWICPLTPLEIWFRIRGGTTAYRGGFIEHYILPVLYPSGLTRKVQLVLGSIVIIINVFVYWKVFFSKKR